MTNNQERAAELRKMGYNCAQCALMALADKVGLDEETAAKIASGLGTGVGGTGEICGAANGIALAEGMLHGSAPAVKAEAMKAVRALIDRFKNENGGRIECRDLKGKEGVRPCLELILQAVGIFEEAHPEI